MEWVLESSHCMHSLPFHLLRFWFLVRPSSSAPAANMSTAVLSVRRAEGSPAEVTPCCDGAELLLEQTLPIGKDGRVVLQKQLLADSVSLGETTEDSPFSMAHPLFNQYVRVTDDKEAYYVVPRKGWKREPVLELSFTVANSGLSQSAVGTIVLSTPRTAHNDDKATGCLGLLWRKWRNGTSTKPDPFNKDQTSTKVVKPLKQRFL